MCIIGVYGVWGEGQLMCLCFLDFPAMGRGGGWLEGLVLECAESVEMYRFTGTAVRRTLTLK